MWYNWLLLVELDAMAGDVPLRKYTWGRDLSGLRSAGSSPPGVGGTDGAWLLTAATDGFSVLTAAGAFSPVAGVAFAPVAADLRVGRSAGRGVPVLQAAGGTLDTRPVARRLGVLRDRGHAPAGVRQGQAGNLLAIEDPDDPNDPADPHGSFACFYDANGNLAQLVDLADGSLAARYEYDPYGNLTCPDTDGDGVFDPATDDAGPYASRNPFRFSTKYFDDETGFGYVHGRQLLHLGQIPSTSTTKPASATGVIATTGRNSAAGSAATRSANWAG